MLAAVHNKAVQRTSELEDEKDDGSELAELTDALAKLRQSRGDACASKARVECLTSDVVSKDDKVTALAAAIKDLKLQVKSAQARAQSISAGTSPTGTTAIAKIHFPEKIKWYLMRRFFPEAGTALDFESYKHDPSDGFAGISFWNSISYR